ncbi:hypothetical protein BDN67DRAFT_363638 [Paxillus ammoniavirescens]|nr:hypothetical protein BDN67DRAFT_363638 [Paxillus ammoniavirescens]
MLCGTPLGPSDQRYPLDFWKLDLNWTVHMCCGRRRPHLKGCNLVCYAAALHSLAWFLTNSRTGREALVLKLNIIFKAGVLVWKNPTPHTIRIILLPCNFQQ